MAYTLPELPYAKDALAPHMSAETFDFHYSKHHKTYVDNANKLVAGTIEKIETIDDVIRSRAEHWRIERMAIVDRNVLRLAVYEFLHHDTPDNVAITQALELARRFSSFEATQFINGILDAIKQDIENKSQPDDNPEKSHASSN